MRGNKSIFKEIDWVLIGIYFLFLLLGWVAIYAVTSHFGSDEIFDFSTKHGKQLLWIGVNIPVIFVVLALEPKFYERYSSIFYLVGLVLLLGVLVFGKNINGATSWYSFGSVTLQPSEFAKPIMALAIAKLLSDRLFSLKHLKNQRQVFVLLALPVVLILLQPDAGSALVFLSFFLLFYREGLPSYYIVIGGFIALLFLLTLVFGRLYVILGLSFIVGMLLLFFYFYKKREKFFKKYWQRTFVLYLSSIAFVFCVNFLFHNILKQHHRDRINIVLGKKVGGGADYNKRQALISIASGGVSGKGFLQGDRTVGNFIPEQETDYIFTSVAEEWGFVGSSLVVVLFVIFILRIIAVAERQKAKFSRVYGYGVATIFFTHFVVNIGMVLGVLPTIGVPLPFFSYGGSSLIGFTILLFILIKLDANRTNDF